ncbi:MAG: hypothetical protein IJE93_02825 [Clostridia bacterium]|nr:hypothetical protein [Clostridia bacterium]
MKKIKKVISFIVVLCLLSGCFCITAAADGTRKTALPTSAGIGALRSEFSEAVADEAGGYALDYCYYSPVGKNDTNKYPVVIFLHGIGHGDYPGSQLEDSDMPYWASSELQSRFTSGGAFIVLPRAPENKLVYWSTSLLEALREVIDDVIENYGDNIDTTKIFIGGLSAGGEMTWNMVTAYPEYFAGAFPMVPTGTFSKNSVKACSDVAIWLMASSKDPVISYIAAIKPLWNNICEYNSQPENCRFSTFGKVLNPDGTAATDNHHMANVIAYDLDMLDGSVYPNLSTVDGNGNAVDLSGEKGMITWMNSLESSFDGNTDSGTGNGKVNGFTDMLNAIRSFFLKIVNMFQRLFGLQK